MHLRKTTMKIKKQLINIKLALPLLPALLLAAVLPLGHFAADAAEKIKRPPLDAAAPSTFETASFGLG